MGQEVLSPPDVLGWGDTQGGASTSLRRREEGSEGERCTSAVLGEEEGGGLCLRYNVNKNNNYGKI